MGAVTYPNAAVAEFIDQEMVPLRFAYDAQPYATDFKVTWTPTLIVLDEDGVEHHRTVGFLSPKQIIPSLLLGMGKSHFEREEFAEAIAVFDRLLAKYPESKAAPEAIYYRGVARYKSTHDAAPLKEAYERLEAEHPNSDWAERAHAYRLL